MILPRRERAPISSRVNAIDMYLVICIFLVFSALMEYAVILLLLKKRRKPKVQASASIPPLVHMLFPKIEGLSPALADKYFCVLRQYI